MSLDSLGKLCFPTIKEVHNCQQIVRFHPSHIDERGRVLVSTKQPLKEWTGSSQDHLVGFHLMTILTGQSHISKVVVLSQVSESSTLILILAKYFI